MKFKISWKIYFAVSFLLLLVITYFLLQSVYTIVFSILGLCYFVFDKILSFDKHDTNNSNSLTQFLKCKFKNLTFLRNITIIIWLFILGIIAVHFIFLSKNQIIKPSVKIFAGIIWDENNEPLDSVIVFLPEDILVDTTNDFGKFEFYIQSEKEITINIIAKKKGYHTYDSDGTLGNRSYNFILRKIK